MHLTPLFLWPCRVLRGQVLLQQLIPPAALGAACLRAHNHPFSLCSEAGMEKCHLFFFPLFSGGLLPWECARNIEMPLQKVGFSDKY